MPFILFRTATESDLFFDLGRLTNSVAEIVEFSTSDVTGTGDINCNDVGRMDREGLLNTNSVRHTSYSEGLGNAAAMFSDDGAFEHLNSLAGSLFDTVVNTHVVTYVDSRKLLLELLVCNSCNVIHYKPLLLYFKDNEDIHAERAADCPRAPKSHSDIISHTNEKIKGFWKFF